MSAGPVTKRPRLGGLGSAASLLSRGCSPRAGVGRAAPGEGPCPVCPVFHTAFLLPRPVSWTLGEGPLQPHLNSIAPSETPSPNSLILRYGALGPQHKNQGDTVEP